jgi:hypothetical protein
MVDRGANIDLIFRNGLKDYEVLPPQDIWEGIPPVLKKKRSFTLLRIAASMAVLVSLGAGSMFLVNKIETDLSSPELTFNQEESQGVIPALNKNSYNRVAVAGYEPVPDAVAISEPVIDDLMPPVSKFNLPEPGLYRSFIESKKSTSRRQNGSVVRIDPTIYPVNPEGNNNTGESDMELKGESMPVKERSRWSIGALVIPTYYSSVSFSNDDAAKDLIKAEEAAVSYSGGFSFAYKVGKRLSLQTGLYYSSIGQKVTGVDSYSGFTSFNNAKGAGMFSVVTSSGTISSGNRDIYLADNNTGSRVLSALSLDVFDPVKADLSYLSNTVHQSFNYLEIPFVMKYKLFDRTIDFNLTGGISYNLLINNTAYAMSGGEKYYIGNTGSLSPVTFSSSLGMGIEYSFSGKLSLNLEPTFRYYITPLGGLAGSSIHPYSFGVLSGISYRF